MRAFVGTREYHEHKKKRFRTGDEPDLTKSEAFRLGNPETRKLYESAYLATRALYYRDMPAFSEILDSIATASQDL